MTFFGSFFIQRLRIFGVCFLWFFLIAPLSERLHCQTSTEPSSSCITSGKCNILAPSLVCNQTSSAALKNRLQRDEVAQGGRPTTEKWTQFKGPSLGSSSYDGLNSTHADKQGDKEKNQQNSSTGGSPGHIFWVVPAFKVDYQKNFEPLTAKEKFQEWARGAYDPLGLGAGAVEAGTLEHSSTDGFCGYGTGWNNYGKCFGALELDATASSFIGDFALTTLLHQDPRYFRLGKASFGKRLGYAVSRVFVTYNDSGHTVFYTSALAGTAIASGISNLYYPQQDRGLGHTMSRIAIDLGNTALYNAAAEFWPDFNHVLHRVF